MAVLSGMAGLVLAAARPAVTETEGTTVKAPFRIVDGQGQPIVEVHSNGTATSLHMLYGPASQRQTAATPSSRVSRSGPDSCGPSPLANRMSVSLGLI